MNRFRASMLVASALTVIVAVGASACARDTGPVVVDQPSLPRAPSAPAGDEPALEALEIDLVPVADGFDQPLLVLGAGDGSDRLFVAEKEGLLKVVRDGQVDPEPFLDLSDSVSTDSERGLLGVAFPEGFAEHGRFYVSYTARDGTSTISRFLATEDGARRDTETVLLRVAQPFANHNGGHVAFGPDGFLYTSLGDGGSGGDPMAHGQNLFTLLGAMLRIDVGESPESSISPAEATYAIPRDNPFADGADALPEIWSYGLRNPWRFSFDRATGDLWIADVGQNAVEEVNFQPASSTGGENWGWNLFEGTAPFPPNRQATEDRDDFAWPIVEYGHAVGRSVTGGFVYRGAAFPQMRGVYFYGDFVSGRIWGLVRAADGSASTRELARTDLRVVSFGEDDAGELYIVDFGGALYRVEAAR